LRADAENAEALHQPKFGQFDPTTDYTDTTDSRASPATLIFQPHDQGERSFSEGIDYPCPSVKSVVSIAVSGISVIRAISGQISEFPTARQKGIRLFPHLAPLCGHEELRQTSCLSHSRSGWFGTSGRNR